MTEVSGISKEIEHKYLLSGLPELYKLEFSGRPLTSFFVNHGWIPGDVIQERITWNSRGAGECWRAIKSGKGLERIEAQERITPELYAQLWPLTEAARVYKTRHCVQESDGLWELDDFNDRILYLAEIEVPSVDTVVRIPDWLAPWIVREVTEEPEYLNVNLAKQV